MCFTQGVSNSLLLFQAPRVPPHGLPLFIPQDSDPQNPVSGSSYLGNVQTGGYNKHTLLLINPTCLKRELQFLKGCVINVFTTQLRYLLSQILRNY